MKQIEQEICLSLDPLQRQLRDGYITYQELRLTALQIANKHKLTLRTIYKVWYNSESVF
jgi:hypothetical protein